MQIIMLRFTSYNFEISDPLNLHYLIAIFCTKNPLSLNGRLFSVDILHEVGALHYDAFYQALRHSSDVPFTTAIQDALETICECLHIDVLL